MDAGNLAGLAEKVRAASRAGVLVLLDDVWPGGEEVLAARAESEWAVGFPDVTVIREGEKTYLFSERHMTRSYAEAAAQGASGDPMRIIAATVRSDSTVYPRPTQVAAFYDPPFLLSKTEVAAAIGRMRKDTQYADIRSVHASDGSEFLFSSNHLSCDQAAAMAEWTAVGRFDNP